MIFTSYDFLIFFFIVFILYWLARRREWQNILLLAASYVFYGWVHPWYALLLGLSTLADYGLARLGLQADALLVQVLLPAGLSFYTLKKLGYIIDVARGNLEPTRSLIDFGLFVAFFPQINAGPIDRAQKLLPQIQSPRSWKAENFYSAWPLIVMGFFKKVVVADTVRVMVDRIYSLREPTIFLIVAAGLGFMLQILADFSAYTDLARAVARLFGFDTSENFRMPYLSLTPTDFWNRWHITLSTWLRDYIFFPLRRALLRARWPQALTDSIPPLLTMLVSGIWHGAGWNFVIWGLTFGVLIVLYQAAGMGGAWKPSNKLTGFLAWLGMFLVILVTFIIFRAPSLGWVFTTLATSPLAGSLDERGVAVVMLSMTLFYAAPLVVKLLLDRYLKPNSFVQDLYHVAATVTLLVYLNSSSPDFIYFQF